MNETTQEILLPVSIENAYDLGEQYDVQHLSGGQVNETLLVMSPERQLILRKLSPLLGTLTIHKTFTIANHLAEQGWEAPLIEQTRGGEPYTYDESGFIWHGMAYIHSDEVIPSSIDYSFIGTAGNLIGGWHRDVQSLSYSPDSLPHFHDTDYIAGKLGADLPLLDSSGQELAQTFLREYQTVAKGLDIAEEQQIIHGDPKLDNMLYRSGQPFTLIDLDCSLRASTWIDIGDFLRSVHGKLLSSQLDYSGPVSDVNTAFMDGYLDATNTRLSSDQAVSQASIATKKIAIELGMRYLSDIVDGAHYFSWERQTYQSRQGALYDKASLQMSILQEIKHQLNEG